MSYHRQPSRYLDEDLEAFRSAVALFVDREIRPEAFEGAGFRLRAGLNPSAVTVAYEPAGRLLTGNGPQAIDARTDQLQSIASPRPAQNEARPSS